jgi:hypothetical protein
MMKGYSEGGTWMGRVRRATKKTTLAITAIAAAGALGLAGCRGEAPLAPPAYECFRVADPYAMPGIWQRGNFHMHSEHSDGALTPERLVELYSRNGYAVLCISDHNQYGNQDGGTLPQYQSDSLVYDWNGDGMLHPEHVYGSGVEAYVREWSRQPPKWAIDQWMRPALTKWEDTPVLLPGAEMSRLGWHFGVIGLPPGPLEPPNAGDGYLDRARAAGGFVTLAHPGEWNGRPGDLARVLDLHRLDAIEIMNGLRLSYQAHGIPVPRPAAAGDGAPEDACASSSTPDATPLWDGLLSRGYRLWGIANDDCHTWEGADAAYPFSAFDMLLTADPSAEGFLAALHSGSFYGSTGLFFRELGVRGDSVLVSAPGATRLRFIGWGGRVLQENRTDQAVYACTGNEGYVRVEATGAQDPKHGWLLQAWSQPFYIEAAPCEAAPANRNEGD